MAQVSMGECRWRMLRRVLRKKRFRYEDARNMTRQDPMHFEWLHENAFVATVGDEWYTVTPRGHAAADLGYYEV